jgi:hypothetical protein
VIQKLARHSDPKLTFNIYARCFAENEQKALAVLPNFGVKVFDCRFDQTAQKDRIQGKNFG